MGANRELPALGARLLNALLAAGALSAALLAGALARAADGTTDAQLEPAQASAWSPARALAECPGGVSAWVAFPSDSPSHATGEGAIVWNASARCPGGQGARVAPLRAGDLPGESAVPRTAAGLPLALRGPLLASGAPHGQIAIAGYAPATPSTHGAPVSAREAAPSVYGAPPGAGLLIQGAAGGRFSTLVPAGGAKAPMALATAYLGDLALAAPPVHDADASGATEGASAPGTSTNATRGAELGVHVERFYAHSFARNGVVGAGGVGPVLAPTLALDYRGEALAVWAQGTGIYAQLLPQQGPPGPIQRLARGVAHAHVTAVLSDDEHGIVAWGEQLGDETAIYLDRSAVGVRFGAAELVERFRDPDGLAAPAASPRLVRLSSESVMLAWSGESAGRWVVRTAPVELGGRGPASTIAPPGQDALLAGLVAGPRGEALALWTEPEPAGAGRVDVERQALFAASGYDAYPGETLFGEPEEIAPPAPVASVSAAFDPDSGRAIAVWRGQAGAIEYSVRAAERAA